MLKAIVNNFSTDANPIRVEATDWKQAYQLRFGNFFDETDVAELTAIAKLLNELTKKIYGPNGCSLLNLSEDLGKKILNTIETLLFEYESIRKRAFKHFKSPVCDEINTLKFNLNIQLTLDGLTPDWLKIEPLSCRWEQEYQMLFEKVAAEVKKWIQERPCLNWLKEPETFLSDFWKNFNFLIEADPQLHFLSENDPNFEITIGNFELSLINQYIKPLESHTLSLIKKQFCFDFEQEFKAWRLENPMSESDLGLIFFSPREALKDFYYEFNQAFQAILRDLYRSTFKGINLSINETEELYKQTELRYGAEAKLDSARKEQEAYQHLQSLEPFEKPEANLSQKKLSLSEAESEGHPFNCAELCDHCAEAKAYRFQQWLEENHAHQYGDQDDHDDWGF